MSSLPQHTVTHATPVMVIDDYLPLVRILAETLYLEGYRVAPMVMPRDRATLLCWHIARILRHADRPTIILADAMALTLPGTQALTTYLLDEAPRQHHLLYLMTSLPEAEAASATARFHAAGRLSKPVDPSALLTLIADGERILRDCASTPPDPFTIDL